jgi:hypothetical protein
MVSGTAEAIAIDATEYTVTEHFMVSDVDARIQTSRHVQAAVSISMAI